MAQLPKRLETLLAHRIISCSSRYLAARASARVGTLSPCRSPNRRPLQLTRQQRELDRFPPFHSIGYGLEVAKTTQAGPETVYSILAGPDPVY